MATTQAIVTVSVTAEDIAKGTPRRNMQSPVGEALWRATGQRWEVFPEYAQAIEPQPRRRLVFDPQVTHKINLYNTMKVMQPFEFQIYVPEPRQ